MSATVTTRVDIHVKILGERVISRAKARDTGMLVYVPHFVRLPDACAHAERFLDGDLLVVPAREMFAGSWHDRKYVLAVGLSGPVPDFITLDGAFAEFNRQGMTAFVPHPTLLMASLTTGDVTVRRDDINAVETYNTKALPRDNRRGCDIARETGLLGFVSSYVHLRGTIGEAWTEFGRDIDSGADLVTALHEGVERRVIRRTDVSHGSRDAAEFAHLGYENPWGKIDRLLLSGMEPTHPDHIAYDGRFDDVSVH